MIFGATPEHMAACEASGRRISQPANFKRKGIFRCAKKFKRKPREGHVYYHDLLELATRYGIKGRYKKRKDELWRLVNEEEDKRARQKANMTKNVGLVRGKGIAYPSKRMLKRVPFTTRRRKKA